MKTHPGTPLWQDILLGLLSGAVVIAAVWLYWRIANGGPL